MVEVTARRVKANGTQLPLFFGAIIGHSFAELSTKSTSFVAPGVGFKVYPGGGNAMILPIALDLPTWNELLDDDPYDMPDNYSFNAATGSVGPGSDGIAEVNIYPSQNTLMPAGNRGTVDIGSSNNSTADLSRQILYGINSNDMSYMTNGELVVDPGPLFLNGDTGISAGTKDELAQIIGEPRAIPLFIEVSGNGNNATYSVVRFVGVRVMAVKLTGPMSKKHLIVQPTPFRDSTVIRGEAVITPDMIYSQPSLIE
jgi:hypothetical protein